MATKSFPSFWLYFMKNVSEKLLLEFGTLKKISHTKAWRSQASHNITCFSKTLSCWWAMRILTPWIKKKNLHFFVSFRLFKGRKWRRPRIISPIFNQLKIRHVKWVCNLEHNPHRSKTDAIDCATEVLTSPHRWEECSLLSRIHFHQDVKWNVRRCYAGWRTITSPGLHSTVQTPYYFMPSWHPSCLCLRQVNSQQVALLSHKQITV